MRSPDSPRPPGVVVAAFDFDGTLTHGGSVWRFLVAARAPERYWAPPPRSPPSCWWPP